MFVIFLKRNFGLFLATFLVFSMVFPDSVLAARNYTETVTDQCNIGSVFIIGGVDSTASMVITDQAWSASRIPFEMYQNSDVRVLKPVVQDTTNHTVLFAGTSPFWIKTAHARSLGSSFTKESLEAFFKGWLKGFIIPGVNFFSNADVLITALRNRGTFTLEAYGGARLRDTFPTQPHATFQVIYKVTITVDETTKSLWGLMPPGEFISKLDSTNWWLNSGSCRFLINPDSFENIIGSVGVDIDGDGTADGDGMSGVEEGDTLSNNLPSPNGPETQAPEDEGACKFSDFTGGDKLVRWAACITVDAVFKAAAALFELVTGIKIEVTT